MDRRTFLHQSLRYLATWGALLSIPKSAVQEAEQSLIHLYENHETGIDWADIRKQFMLDSEIAYLNTGTLGACPKTVFETTQKTWERLERNPAVLGFRKFVRLSDQARRRAAEFLGAEPNEVTLVQNTTEGINLIACAVKLRPGDEILSTNHEHPGGRVGWEYLAKYHQVKFVQVDLNDQFLSTEEIVQKFREMITPRTRIISVAHVLFTTGLKMPIQKLAQLAHEHDLLMVVDGAQVPGMLNVDVKALQCDIYASSSHKWLLAPKGTGLLYIARPIQEIIRPIPLESGFSAYTAHTGTRNFPALIGHGTALSWHQILGPERIEARVLELSRYCYRRLQEFKTIRLLRPLHPEIDSGMIAFSAPSGWKNIRLVADLEKQGVIVKVLPLLNGIRISTHVYNNKADINRLVEALHNLGIR